MASRTIASLIFSGSLLLAQLAIDPSELRVSSSSYSPPTLAALGAQVRLVEVLAVVRDKMGKPISGLTRADFDLRDEGKKRDLTGFSIQQAQPHPVVVPAQAGTAPYRTPPMAAQAAPSASRSIAILFDDLNSTAADFMQVRNAALRFVKEGLAPGDRVGIFTTLRSQVLPFTSDPLQLTSAISALTPRERPVNTADCPYLTPYFGYLLANNLDRQALTAKVAEMQHCDPGSQVPATATKGRAGRGGSSSTETTNWDTAPGDVGWEDPVALKVVRLARMIWEEQENNSKDTFGTIQNVVALVASQSGQRIILLGSSGFLAGTLENEQETLIARAVHAGVVINSLDAKGLYTGDPSTKPLGGVGERASIYAAKLGTRPKDAANDVMENLSDGTGGRFFRNSNDLAAGFSELTEVPEVSYLLAFTPPDPDGKFHRLKVQVPGGKGYTVQARLGYLSEKERVSSPTEERRIDREVFTAGQSRDAPVGLELTSETSKAGATMVKAAFHVDVRTLPFIEKAGVRTEKLTFLLALLDADGNFVSGKEGSMQFALTQGTFARLQGTRLDAGLQIELPPSGAYRLRILIDEANGGKMTEATQLMQMK